MESVTFAHNLPLITVPTEVDLNNTDAIEGDSKVHAIFKKYDSHFINALELCGELLSSLGSLSAEMSFISAQIDARKIVGSVEIRSEERTGWEEKLQKFDERIGAIERIESWKQTATVVYRFMQRSIPPATSIPALTATGIQARSQAIEHTNKVQLYEASITAALNQICKLACLWKESAGELRRRINGIASPRSPAVEEPSLCLCISRRC